MIPDLLDEFWAQHHKKQAADYKEIEGGRVVTFEPTMAHPSGILTVWRYVESGSFVQEVRMTGSYAHVRDTFEEIEDEDQVRDLSRRHPGQVTN